MSFVANVILSIGGCEEECIDVEPKVVPFSFLSRTRKTINFHFMKLIPPSKSWTRRI